MGKNPIIAQRILTILRYSEVFLIVEVVRPSFLTNFFTISYLRNSEVAINNSYQSSLYKKIYGIVNYIYWRY